MRGGVSFLSPHNPCQQLACRSVSTCRALRKQVRRRLLAVGAKRSLWGLLGRLLPTEQCTFQQKGTGPIKDHSKPSPCWDRGFCSAAPLCITTSAPWECSGLGGSSRSWGHPRLTRQAVTDWKGGGELSQHSPPLPFASMLLARAEA